MILLNIDEDAPWLSEPLARLAQELGIGWADAGVPWGSAGRGVRLRLPRPIRTGIRRAMPFWRTSCVTPCADR